VVSSVIKKEIVYGKAPQVSQSLMGNKTRTFEAAITATMAIKANSNRNMTNPVLLLTHKILSK
jgi:hypothetical protein